MQKKKTNQHCVAGFQAGSTMHKGVYHEVSGTFYDRRTTQ